MVNEILQNLRSLFNESYSFAKKGSFEKIIDDYINETNQHYLNIGINNYLDDEEPIDLNRIKKNPELEKSFNKAYELNFDETQIISNFKSDIQKAYSEIKLKLQYGKVEIKNQAIFLEFDIAPRASISGYGTGNYPILKKPDQLGFYPKDEIYIAIDKIEYSLLWRDLISLNETIENYELDDYVFDSGKYQALRDSIIFKTYILLHMAFEKLGIGIFNGIEIKKPLMIYGNEHDGDPINIYAFE